MKRVNQTGNCCAAIAWRQPDGTSDDACVSNLTTFCSCRCQCNSQVLALVGLFVHCRRERNAKFPPEVEQVCKLGSSDICLLALHLHDASLAVHNHRVTAERLACMHGKGLCRSLLFVVPRL